MKLPNAEHAIVELEKLTDYCLSPDHPRGKHKARVFEAVLGITAAHADVFQRQLLEVAESAEAVEIVSDVHGRRFVIECLMRGPTGEAVVHTAWMVRRTEEFPRFVSAYVK